MAKQLTLSLPGGQIMPTIVLWAPRFLDFATALLSVCNNLLHSVLCVKIQSNLRIIETLTILVRTEGSKFIHVQILHVYDWLHDNNTNIDLETNKTFHVGPSS